jgi:hypothetical protein
MTKLLDYDGIDGNFRPKKEVSDAHEGALVLRRHARDIFDLCQTRGSPTAICGLPIDIKLLAGEPHGSHDQE